MSVPEVEPEFMEQESVGVPTTRAATGRLVVHLDARPNSGDPLERLSWSVDEAGREALAMPEIRDQLKLLMTWPGRVSGWRRTSHVWVCDVRWGETYILGVENAHTWTRPGVATLDPASIVGTASHGCPPAIRTVRLSDRMDHIVVAAICLPSGAASLMEMRIAGGLPGTGMLAEVFAAGRGDAAGFRINNEQFDLVTPVGVVVLNAGLSLETAALVGDATGAARAWIRVEHVGDIPPEMGISLDNSKVADKKTGRISETQRARHLGELRRAVVAALGGR